MSSPIVVGSAVLTRPRLGDDSPRLGEVVRVVPGCCPRRGIQERVELEEVWNGYLVVRKTTRQVFVARQFAGFVVRMADGKTRFFKHDELTKTEVIR